jgi:hypothetical protein
MRKTGIILTFVLLAVLVTACTAVSGSSIPFASVPAGMGYAEGKEIFFSHTEVSDPEVGKKLTSMMNSPVLVVPSLAKVPADLTPPVYVFQNGLAGKGPLGFQADVFSDPPGTGNYFPMRRITFVNWADPAKAAVLKSASEVADKAKSGELTLKASDIVVNMPFMMWDGGKR